MLKKLTKGLSLLLALCMLVTLLPVGAMATEAGTEPEEPVVSEEPAETTEPAEPTEEPAEETPAEPDGEETPVEEPASEEEPTVEPQEEESAEEDPDAGIMPLDLNEDEGVAEAAVPYTGDFLKIVHLDCGRKYFTKEWVIALIHEMKADGYNALELAFGNDGLRFLLDDMSVTVNNVAYSDDDVTAGIQKGNENYYNAGEKNEWTQAEMDEIIAAANTAGIQIIPLLNTPGHMNAIVTCMKEIGISDPSYNQSVTTVNLENSTAVDFTKALVQKYITYFRGKGCTVFNMGCDEYANDIYTSGSMGFGNLVSNGNYGKFVSYVNDLAALVQNAGMTPMAFNDGFYFYGNTGSESFDTNIMISFWTSGWPGYQSESAQQLSGRGHKMVNTNGDYYYVLGKDDAFTPGKTTTHDASLYTAAASFSNTKFMGGTVDNPAGSMFCIWCDYPNAETETQIAANTRLVLRAMAARMGDESIDNIDTSVVPNGFNADGTINKVSETEPAAPTIQKDGKDVSTFSVKMGETATLSLSDSNATATWSSSNEKVATVAAVTRSVEANSVTVTPVGEGTATITAALSDGTKLTTDVTVTAADTSAEPAYDEVIVLDVGGKTTKTQEGVNNQEKTDTSSYNPSIAKVTVTGKDGTSSGFRYDEESNVKCNTLCGKDSDWVKTEYYYLYNGNYYPLYAKRSSNYISYTWTFGYSVTDTANNVEKVRTQTGYKYISSNPTVEIVVYSKVTTAPTPASTTIEFEGIYPGTTYYKVGDTTYKIVVNYKTETVTVVLDQDPVVVTVSGTADTSKLDTSIATVSIDNGTMTVTGVAEGETKVTVGDTIYTIKVTKEDLSAVTGQTVEFWITNQQVTANGGTSMTIAASASGVHSESGVLFSSLVPATGTQGSNTMDFWKGTRLASDNKQTTGSGVDKTTSGTDFTYIRYWNGSWAYSSDGKTWINVESGDQIVAYYLQRTDVTDEITTQVVDWGPKKANWGDLNYLGKKYVLLDYTVKYESGEETPSSFPTDKSLGFHCDTQTKKDNYYYRTLGMIRGVENANYEVYMITLTPTSDSPSTVLASTAAGNTSYEYKGTEVVAWAATQDDLDNSDLGTYTSISGAFTYSIGGEPIVSGLEIYRQHGMKVTFYVRAKVTEDSLAVHYIDQTANQEFYSYNIAVKSGTLFNENIGLADPWKGNLANGSVTNLQDKTQTVSADLSTMPAIGAQYRYSDYTCVSVTRSEDGKNVYLYYTFNNAKSFVVDFGLPLKITTDALGIEGDWTSASVSGAQYGTATATIGEGITYTPTETLKGVETLQLTLTGSTGSVTHQIYIYPATTVYYEEGFATLTGFTGGSKGSGTQATQIAGSSSDEYGYDAKYAGESNGASNGTQATSSAKGDQAEFSFTGTGVDIYTNSTRDTGWLMIQVKNSTGGTAKLLQVNTALQNGSTDATNAQAVNGYNVPVASIIGLSHGSYTVTITNLKDVKVNLDGFRVYGTLENQSNDVYQADLEDNPTFIELRDQVLAGLSVTSTGDGQVNAALPKDDPVTSVVVGSSEKYTQDEIDDLLNNGPKNEIYLQPNQALVLKITTAREVQIGLKALNAATNYTINNVSKSIGTSTDMFYTVLNKGTSSEQTITITNTGSGILAVTKLKVCDDPNAALVPLTADDLADALTALGIVEKEPTEPEVTYADATLTVKVNDASAVLTANGVVGEKATFTAADIQAAAKALVPEGYELDEAQFTDVEVAYGESDELTFTASEQHTEPEPEPAPDPEPTPDPEPEQPPQNIWQKLNNFLKKLFWWL